MSVDTELDDFDDEDDANDPDAKTPEQLALEAEFEAVVKKAHSEIDAEVKIARDHIARAVKLSEKYGIPFHAGVSPLGNNYTPQSFKTKFPGLDTEFVSDVTGTWDEENYQYGGWQHSAVC
jgi:hypothetical protein